jgi:hypothetical protein
MLFTKIAKTGKYGAIGRHWEYINKHKQGSGRISERCEVISKMSWYPAEVCVVIVVAAKAAMPIVTVI